MPIYFRSKQVKGVDYVFYNGKSYKRTGKYVPKSTTSSVPLSDVDIMYVESCSAAELGNLELNVNGTLTVPTSTSEFQLKYKGENSGDTGILVLEDENGNTCNISLSVNAVSALVFDVASSGVPSPYTFVTYPTTLDYVDCLSNQWKITFASKGSYYLVFDWQGKSKFVCGEAEIDLSAIYNVGSDSRTGLGGQIHADPDDTTSPGYSLKYRTLNYGVDTQNGTVGRPIILEDVIAQGENVEIFMRGTNGTGPKWETATGENLAANEFGLSATAGGFANGESWEKLVFPTGTYSTSATLFYGNSARICFSGTAATGANGDRHFTVLRELIDVKSIPKGSTSNVQVEYDGETFLRFEGSTAGDTATVVMSAPAGHTCTVMLSVDNQQNLVFNAGDLNNSLLFTSFPDTQQWVDCMGDEYDVTFTGKGSYRVTVGNMKPFMRRKTGIAKIDARQGNWYNYNVSGVNNGKYEMTMQNWSNIKTPDKKQPAATVVQENPDINITLGDGITFDVHHFPIKLPGDGDQLQIADAHPLWIKTVQSPGKPGPGETPPGVIINNGLQDTPNFTNKYRFLRFRPTEAGTYYYNCEHHASMSGKIVVTEASVNPPPPAFDPSLYTGWVSVLEDNWNDPGVPDSRKRINLPKTLGTGAELFNKWVKAPECRKLIDELSPGPAYETHEPTQYYATSADCAGAVAPQPPAGPFTYEYEFTPHTLASNPAIQWWDSTVLASPAHRTGRQVSAGINHHVTSTTDKYSKQPVICIHKDDTIRIKNSAGSSHPMEMKLINDRPSVSESLDTAALEALWGSLGGMNVLDLSNDTDFTTIPSQDSNRFLDVVNGWHQLDTGDQNSGPGWIYMIRCANHHSMVWFLEIKNDLGNHNTDDKCPGLRKNPADETHPEET